MSCCLCRRVLSHVLACRVVQLVWIGWMPTETSSTFAVGWSSALMAALTLPPFVSDSILVVSDALVSSTALDITPASQLAHTLQGHTVRTVPHAANKLGSASVSDVLVGVNAVLLPSQRYSPFVFSSAEADSWR